MLFRAAVFGEFLMGVRLQLRLGKWGSLAASLFMAAALAACGDSSSSLPTASNTQPNASSPDPSAPVITGTPSMLVQAGNIYTFRPSASDPNGQTLKFQITGQPGWVIFDTNTGQMTGTPANTDIGETAEITIAVTNGTQSASLAPFVITITAPPVATPPGPSPPPVNTPPQISGVPATTVVAGQAYTFLPTASDPDHDTLVFSVTNKPSWASFSTTTGQLAGTPAKTNVATFSNITITVSDGKANTSLPAFAIIVQALPNHAPTISGTPAASVIAGSGYAFAPAASDQDGDTLTFSIQNKPTWATFSTSTGKLSGTPSSSQIGAYSNIVIAVSDGKVTTSLTAFTITVTAASSGAPTISGTPGTTVTAGSAYSFQPTAKGASGSTLTFSIQSKPTWATFNTSSGLLSGTPAAGDAGTTSNIVISVSDGTTSASLAAFSITVNQVSNGSAVLSWTAPMQNVDGSSLTTFAGYKILYGTSATALTQTAQVANPTVTTYTVGNLASGTWYFSVEVYLSDGTLSAKSNPVSVTVP
jgi:hypothetical protein